MNPVKDASSESADLLTALATTLEQLTARVCRDLDVDAEHAGEDRGGDLGGEGNRAVDLAWRGWTPMFFSRIPRRASPMGWPGRPPGNSHGVVPGRPMAAWPGRVARSSRTRPASGSGRTTGAVPSMISTRSPWSRMWPVVSLAMLAMRWA